MLLDNQIIYSFYIKKNHQFNQCEKEEQYIYLLDRIVSSIPHNVEIIFDAFNKVDFEDNIIEYIGKKENVLNIESRNSYDEPGIQFVDNLCSVIRLSYLDSKNNYYQIIKDKVSQV